MSRRAQDFLDPDLNMRIFPDMQDMFPGLTGFVYAIRADGFGVSKIGFATNLPDRLMHLQSGSWVPLSFGAVFCLYGAEPSIIEKIAHQIAAKRAKRLKGEWFALKPEDAAEVIFDAVDLNESVARSYAECWRFSIQSAAQNDDCDEDRRRRQLRRKLGIDD